MKTLTHAYDSFGLRMALMICAIFTLIQSSAFAQTPDLFDSAGTEITANKEKLLTLLGIVFTIVMVGVAYKLVKRGANKV